MTRWSEIIAPHPNNFHPPMHRGLGEHAGVIRRNPGSSPGARGADFFLIFRFITKFDLKVFIK